MRALLVPFILALSSPPAPAEPDALRTRYPAALSAIRQGADPAAYETLRDYPLWPYLVHAALAREPRTTRAEAVLDFVERHPDTPLAERLRRQFLAEFARRGDWRALERLYQPGTANLAERCLMLRAAIARGRPVASEVYAELLREAGAETPSACEPVWAHWWGKGGPNAEQRRGRLEALLDAGRFEAARAWIGRLPPAERPAAERALLAARDPNTALQRAAAWPDEPSSRAALSRALRARARSDPLAADGAWRQWSERFAFSTAERTSIANAIARHGAIKTLPEARAWLDRLPFSDYEDATFEWAVRYALRTRDLAAVVRTVEAMPEPLARLPRWRYARARALELDGRTEAAAAAYAELAREANFHGFLAADRLGAPYRLCPLPATPGQLEVSELPGGAARARVQELYALGEDHAALAEWLYLLRTVDRDTRARLGLYAAERGWHHAAILSLNAPEHWPHYHARFPLVWLDQARRQAEREGLDLAWMLGLIRAESAWNRKAVSSAGAVGLMQLMPATAQRLLKRKRAPTRAELMNAELSLELGARYLGAMLERFGGNPMLATGAYNAGPGAVERWRDEWTESVPDLWLETVPYFETRDYVPRVLAFSVIYDWRLDGPLRRLSSRLPGMPEVRAPASVSCPEAKLAALPESASARESR